MSVGELKRAVDELSANDRLELAEYIRNGLRANDPSWQAELERRLDACLQGKGHGAEELLTLHDRLSAKGL
jgi:putative addiction module component (TIGR02574 family)